MKINEIIRERRNVKGFTQEQIAHYLGVSTPAVNKWEKGVSYPDITLLPALARILDTDLNTLLSFQDDLTQEEIILFMNEVSEIIENDGFEAGFNCAMNKVKEYPTCDSLLYNIAVLLDGASMLNDNKKYQKEIEELYYRVIHSQDISIKEQAQERLISKLIDKQDYQQAQEILDTFSKKSTVDKKQIQAEIYFSQGKFEKASQIIEEKLLLLTTEIHNTLMSLIDISIKDERIEDAEYIVNVAKQAVELFDLWEYNKYVGYFRLYSVTKNKTEILKTIIPMLRSLKKKWDINQSPLYRHIQTKEVDRSIGLKLQKLIIQSIDKDDDLEFLKDDPSLEEIKKEIDIN